MRRVTPPRKLDPRLIPAAALAAMLSLGCSVPAPTVRIANHSESQRLDVRRSGETTSRAIRPGHFRTIEVHDVEINVADGISEAPYAPDGAKSR